MVSTGHLPTHRNPQADEAQHMERREETIFFACLHWTPLQSDCAYGFSKREQEALVYVHIVSSFKNEDWIKKKIFLILETHIPHLYPKLSLTLFYTNKALQELSTWRAPTSGSSRAFCLLYGHNPCVSFQSPLHTSQKGSHSLSSLHVTYFQTFRWSMMAKQAKTWWQEWVQEGRTAV